MVYAVASILALGRRDGSGASCPSTAGDTPKLVRCEGSQGLALRGAESFEQRPGLDLVALVGWLAMATGSAG